MIFFDLDDTLLNFKQAERNAIKAFYRQFGGRQGQCIMIGDSLETDIWACEKVGMKDVWLNRKKDERHARTIRSLSEIHRHLE